MYKQYNNGACSKESGQEVTIAENQMPEPSAGPDIHIFRPGKLSDLAPRSEIRFVLNSGEAVVGVVMEVTDGIAEIVFKDCLKKERAMNKEQTNEGGYMASDLRTVLNTEILDDMPFWLRQIMVPLDNGDYLGLLKEKEVFAINEYGETDPKEVRQFAIMKDLRYRTAFLGNTGQWEWYWVQNATKISSTPFVCCDSEGEAGYVSAHFPYGVRPRFRIRIGE